MEVQTEAKSRFTFFWRMTEANSWLSNWSPHVLVDDHGIKYYTAEHYLMYQKALLMGDTDIARQILATRKPLSVKQLGRKVRNFDLEKWTAAQQDVMYDALRFKLKSNPELKVALANTRGTVIAEASPYDVIWGIGFAASHPKARQPEFWRGKNLLGEAWMRVRD